MISDFESAFIGLHIENKSPIWKSEEEQKPGNLPNRLRQEKLFIPSTPTYPQKTLQRKK